MQNSADGHFMAFNAKAFFCDFHKINAPPTDQAGDMFAWFFFNYSGKFLLLLACEFGGTPRGLFVDQTLWPPLC